MTPAFSGRYKGHVCGQENGAGDGLGTRLQVTRNEQLFCNNIMFSKFCSIVFTTLQLKFKATGRATRIVHGGESQPALSCGPMQVPPSLPLEKESGRSANCRNYPAVGIAPSYLMNSC